MKILFFLLASNVCLAQNLSFSRLIACQKQNFNTTNNFFISADWESQVVNESRKIDGPYAVAWRKIVNNGFGMIKVEYNTLKPSDGYNFEPTNLNVVTYDFTNRAHFIKVKEDIERAGYKPDKPAFKNGRAFSTYTDGTYVVLLGSLKFDTILGYEIRIMHYAQYAVLYTDLLDK